MTVFRGKEGAHGHPGRRPGRDRGQKLQGWAQEPGNVMDHLQPRQPEAM